MVRLNSVNSREVTAAGYDRDVNELHLLMKDNTLVTYHAVPFQIYQEFLEAKFKGRFVKKFLTGFFMQTDKQYISA